MHEGLLSGVKAIRYTRSEKRAIIVLVAFLLMINLGTLVIRKQDKKVAASDFGTLTESAAVELPEQKLLELNSADSISLLDLYGIGPVFSHRILRYRDLLGGYYDKLQLMEVYGMDEERFSGISSDIWADSSAVRKINLRTVEFRDLLRHPYVSYDMVKAYVRYRDRFGPPDSVEKAMVGAAWPDSLLSKLRPYLSVKVNDE